MESNFETINIHKYQLILENGEEKDFLCEYPPEELEISRGIFNGKYSLNHGNKILFGDCVSFKLLETNQEEREYDYEHRHKMMGINILFLFYEILLIEIVLVGLGGRWLFPINPFEKFPFVTILGIFMIAMISSCIYCLQKWKR